MARASHASPGEPGESRDIAGDVERFFSQWLGGLSLPRNLRAAIEYAFLGGGKRVRPVLVVECAAAAGSDLTREARAAAVAIELVHTFSLVHDDLPAMDDADVRRGRPSLHKHAGEAMAVLAGDALLGLAFEIIASEVRAPEMARALAHELGIATREMIAGQVYDTIPDFEDRVPPLDRLRTIHRHKTVALIRCACRMGALAGGGADLVLTAVTRYGEAIGLMFQVVDDVLDVTQTTSHLGKSAQLDAAHGKLTYPAVLGLDGSRREVERLRGEALDALAPLGERARRLRDICEQLAVRTR